MNQVGNVAGLWVGGRGSQDHDGLYNAKVGGIFTLDGVIFNSVGFEFLGKVPVQVGVSLLVGGVLVSGRH